MTLRLVLQKRNFHLKEDLFNVNSDSNVFFIQETADEQYELIFGDGVFGTKLENSNYIVAYYSTTSRSQRQTMYLSFLLQED